MQTEPDLEASKKSGQTMQGVADFDDGDAERTALLMNGDASTTPSGAKVPSESPQVAHGSDAQFDQSVKNRSHPAFIAIVMIVWTIADLIMPLQNKIIFTGLGPDSTIYSGFSFPLTVSALELIGTALVLLIATLVDHVYKVRKFGSHPSWAFGPHFFRKIVVMFLPALFFSLVIGLSNIGLQKIGVNIHVLLRASSILWVVGLSYFLRNEIPHIVAVVLAVIITIGVAMLSMDEAFDKNILVMPVIVTLVSAFCSGALVVVQRFVSVHTQGPPLRMSVLEMSLFKMAMAATFLIIPAFIMDGLLSQPTVWQALSSIDIRTLIIASVLILIGTIVTIVFQTLLVAMTTSIRAISVGVLQQAMSLPQMLLFTVLASVLPKSWHLATYSPTILHIGGTVLVIVGIACYAGFRLFMDLRRRRRKEDAPN